MTDQIVVDYSFRKKDRAITLGTKSSVKIAGETIKNNPMLLFQRLIIGDERSNEQLQTLPPTAASAMYHSMRVYH